jgi:glutamate carboxypeptidase
MNKNSIEQILKMCRDEQEFFAEQLKELVLFETYTTDTAKNREFLERLAAIFSENGCDTEILPGEDSGGQLQAVLPGSGFQGRQLILGHSDTVWPAGTLEKIPWNRDGDVITGPGVYDMKAGIVMMITALKVMDTLNLRPVLQPVFFINSDEETGSYDSKKKITERAKSVNRCFVPEPGLGTDGKLKTGRKGSGLFDVEVRGVAAHAGIEPEKGISAIHELSYVIQKLSALNNPEKGITVNVGTISGGSAVNVIPEQASAKVNVRVLSVKDMNRVEEKIKSIKPVLMGTDVVVKGSFNRPPMEKNERNSVLWNLAKTISGKMGLSLKDGTTGGGSDGSFATQYTATLDGLGAVGEGAHSLSEKIFLEKTLERCALFTALLAAPDVCE